MPHTRPSRPSFHALPVRLAMVMAMVGLGVVMGGGLFGCVRGAKSPQDLFLQVRSAAAGADYGAIYDLLSRESKARLDTAVNNLAAECATDADALALFGHSRDAATKLSTRAQFIALAKQRGSDSFADRLDFSDAMFSTDPVIVGNRATIVVTFPDGRTHNLHAIVEDGGWRLDGTAYCAQATSPHSPIGAWWPLLIFFALLIFSRFAHRVCPSAR